MAKRQQSASPDAAPDGHVVTVEAGKSPTVTIARVPFVAAKSWEQWVLLISDVHFDSPHCQREQLAKLLAEVNERDGVWTCFGDWFDCMGGKFDPRSSKGELRPEYLAADYLDAITRDTVTWLEPYAQRCLLMSPGNHETGVLKRHEVDLLERVTALANGQYGSRIRKGAYQGWVFWRFSEDRKGGGRRRTLKLRYHHGHGGGGEVTQGVIQAQRRAVYLPDAEIVANGHIHYRWTTEFTRERVSDAGLTYLDSQVHVGLSTFKEEYLRGEGFHVERGRAPKPLGGWWLRFFYDFAAQHVRFDTVRAGGV